MAVPFQGVTINRTGPYWTTPDPTVPAPDPTEPGCIELSGIFSSWGLSAPLSSHTSGDPRIRNSPIPNPGIEKTGLGLESLVDTLGGMTDSSMLNDQSVITGQMH